MTALALLRHYAPALQSSLSDENGLVEWAQVAGFAIAGVLSTSVALTLARGGMAGPACGYALGAAGLFFVCGEELAWGQLLLGFETPGEIASWNTKGEMSVHNFVSVERWFNLAKFAIGLYGACGFLLAQKLGGLRIPRGLQVFVIPGFLSSPFLIVVVLRALRVLRILPPGQGENEELFLAYGSAMFVWFVRQRLAGTDNETRVAATPLDGER